ncbi:MAG: hypothetical protein SFY70_07410 [Bacteroidia bacterium]|nr:hypothetical protein [Bacteroidia bacterium]
MEILLIPGFVALMLVGPTLSRKAAAWGWRRWLARERAGGRNTTWHRTVAAGPPNNTLAATFQAADYLHGVLWLVLGSALWGEGLLFDPRWFEEVLIAYSFSYPFILLIRWPLRRSIQASWRLTRKEGATTLPFFQETLMLWRELAPAAYVYLEHANPEQYRATLFQNLKSERSIVHRDALTRLKALPPETQQLMLMQLATSASAIDRENGVRIARKLQLPDTLPDVLPLGLSDTAWAVRRAAYQLLQTRSLPHQGQAICAALTRLSPTFFELVHAHGLGGTAPYSLPETHTDVLKHLRTRAAAQPSDTLNGTVPAVEAVLDYHKTHSFDQLLGLLRDPDPLIAYYALCQLPQSRLRILEALLSKADAVAMDTEDFYDWLRRTLVPCFSAAEPLVALTALQVFLRLSPDHGRAEAWGWLAPLPPPQQAWLIGFLATTAQPVEAPQFCHYATAADPEVAAQARTGLVRLGEAAVTFLTHILSTPQAHTPQQLERAIHLLADLEHPQALSALLEVKAHPDPALQAAAEAALTRLLTADELTSHLPAPRLTGWQVFTQAEYDLLLSRKDIRLVPRLIERYIACPQRPFNRKPLEGRRALGAIIEATLANQADLAAAYPHLYCRRCLYPTERHTTEAWQTGGKHWAYLWCQRCHHDRFLAPGAGRIVGYLGNLPAAEAATPDVLYLPLWNPAARQAQYTFGALAQVLLCPGLPDEELPWAISAVLTGLRNHHPEAELPPWHLMATIALPDNAARQLAPYLEPVALPA